MDTFKSFIPEIYEVNDQSFVDIALQVFRYQANTNALYAEFLSQLNINPRNVNELDAIPFLPISFFKTHTIQSGEWTPQAVFTSSGTTGIQQSRHLVADIAFYQSHARRCFEFFFGPLDQYHFLALLPSYMEREGSSLISMMQFFVEQSGSAESGFYLKDHERLLSRIETLKNQDRRIILWGVSFALLDLAEKYSVDLSTCLIFETGGMKGRRREITRQELHLILKGRFGVKEIFSEYGMTELFSQAYTSGAFTFKSPPQMRVIGRDMSDPLTKGIINESCGINIIDLANWRTISFIETEDTGKVYSNGSFEILGRLDNSEIRGCNLLL